jgi:nucleoside-diphosphate-sugar epimerase
MKSISILGCGWLGLPLGRELVKRGYNVTGSTTTDSRQAEIAAAGIKPLVLDLKNAVEWTAEVQSFFHADVLVVAFPPKLRTQPPSQYLADTQVVKQLMLRGTVRRMIFVSSSSVYPDLNRVVLEEDADPESVLYQAEECFRACDGLTTVVLRFAGLVGPGRHPGRFLSGKNVGSGSAPINLIHLTDCINIMVRALDLHQSIDLSACADAHPGKKEFYTMACDKLGVEPPRFVDEKREPYKIVSNEKLKHVLKYSFRFPDPMAMTY